MDPSDIQHILIVAGASGAGKTTFLKALAAERLPASITGEVPEGASRWPQSSFKTVLSEGWPKEARAGGVVLHYNLMRAFAMNLPDYHADPAMKLLDAFKGRISVATIVPDERMLTDHILRRAHTAHLRWGAASEGSAPRRAWRRLRNSILRLAGRGLRVKRGQRRLITLYETPGGLQRWLDHWADFLDELCRTRPDTRVIAITPDREAKDRPNFRLVRPEAAAAAE